ncbi:hypothetical protein F4777DRAFT_580354 [Nemania sp. FL0916]|nr:hypothetical protein F4777DRAFT_580354 [Nemania sp. FL0916]
MPTVGAEDPDGYSADGHLASPATVLGCPAVVFCYPSTILGCLATVLGVAIYLTTKLFLLPLLSTTSPQHPLLQNNKQKSLPAGSRRTRVKSRALGFIRIADLGRFCTTCHCVAPPIPPTPETTSAPSQQLEPALAGTEDRPTEPRSSIDWHSWAKSTPDEKEQEGLEAREVKLAQERVEQEEALQREREMWPEPSEPESRRPVLSSGLAHGANVLTPVKHRCVTQGHVHMCERHNEYYALTELRENDNHPIPEPEEQEDDLVSSLRSSMADLSICDGEEVPAAPVTREDDPDIQHMEVLSRNRKIERRHVRRERRER